jgi:DNA-binding IclR family transcriptional regulator
MARPAKHGVPSPELRPKSRILQILQLYESRPVVGSGYVLGPAFVQFDRLVRQSDPLIRLAEPRMQALLRNTTQRAVAVLSRRYRDQVMCVHQELGTAPHPLTLYERGVAMPMFSGATSKVILAHQAERTLERIYLENEEAIRQTLDCTSWKTFRNQLDGIRRAGVAVTHSEVAQGRVGIAAPIFASGQVIAGLSLVLDESESGGQHFSSAVIGAAKEITAALSHEDPWIVRGS